MDTQSTTISVTTQAAVLMVTLLPTFHEIRQVTDMSDETVAKVRTSEGMGVVLGLGLGTIASGLSHSWQPLGYTILTVGSILVATEYLLRSGAQPKVTT